jgi:SAM-dependent methyltransferase
LNAAHEGLIGEFLRRGMEAAAVYRLQDDAAAANEKWPGRAIVSDLPVLDLPDQSCDVVVWLADLADLSEQHFDRAIKEARRLCRRGVYFSFRDTSPEDVRKTRLWWEGRLLEAGFRKGPRHTQLLAERQDPSPTQWSEGLYDALPFDPTDPELGYWASLDLSRQSGPRADVGLEEYLWSAEFIRPGDHVVALGCGTGYGAQILAHGTSASQILGVDPREGVIGYARVAFGETARGLAFEASEPLRFLKACPPASVDFIVFDSSLGAPSETILAAALNALTPGGRICGAFAVEGGTPDPGLVLAEFEDGESGLLVEHVLAPSHPGQVKLVAFRDPVTAKTPYEERAFTKADGELVDFARQYANPWLVRGMISIGLRVSNRRLLIELASRVAAKAGGGVDEAAALCVIAYDLVRSSPSWADSNALIERFKVHTDIDLDSARPIEVRWAVSLLYVEGLLLLGGGQIDKAEAAFIQCARAPFMRYGPLLGTKTVDACVKVARIREAKADRTEALDWHRRAIETARQAVSCDWSRFLGAPDKLSDFAFRELTEILDITTLSASALSLLPEQDHSRFSRQRTLTNHAWQLAQAEHGHEALYHTIESQRQQISKMANDWSKAQEAIRYHANRAAHFEQALAEKVSPPVEPIPTATDDDFQRGVAACLSVSEVLNASLADLAKQRYAARRLDDAVDSLEETHRRLKVDMAKAHADWALQKQNSDNLAARLTGLQSECEALRKQVRGAGDDWAAEKARSDALASSIQEAEAARAALCAEVEVEKSSTHQSSENPPASTHLRP